LPPGDDAQASEAQQGGRDLGDSPTPVCM